MGPAAHRCNGQVRKGGAAACRRHRADTKVLTVAWWPYVCKGVGELTKDMNVIDSVLKIR